MAWFRFTSVDEDPEPDPEAVLRNYTYEQVDSFFASGSSRYGAFYGKRVYSAEELRQQDRTIWFVRPSKGTDPSHEIRLFDSKTVAPYHFPERAIECDANTFLWLSDLHLSPGHHNFPLKSTMAELDLMALEQPMTETALRATGG